MRQAFLANKQRQRSMLSSPGDWQLMKNLFSQAGEREQILPSVIYRIMPTSRETEPRHFAHVMSFFALRRHPPAT